MPTLPLRSLIHMALHILLPGAIAWRFFPLFWQRAWLVMLATMIVDLDHLLATPIFDAQRCGLGFHPLHSWWAIALYVALATVGKTRWVGLGLVIHMVLDGIDCMWIWLESRIG